MIKSVGINEEIVPLIVSRALAPCVLSLGGPWGVWGGGTSAACPACSKLTYLIIQAFYLFSFVMTLFSFVMTLFLSLEILVDRFITLPVLLVVLIEQFSSKLLFYLILPFWKQMLVSPESSCPPCKQREDNMSQFEEARQLLYEATAGE